MASQPRSVLPITIKTITSEADLVICAHLSDIAMKPDGLHEFRARYGPMNVYDDALTKLTEAFRNNKGESQLFKAVALASAVANLETDDEAESAQARTNGKEVVVGFAQYRRGYVEVPKMDPIAPRKEPKDDSNEYTDISVAVTETTGQVPVVSSGLDDKLLEAAHANSARPYYSDPLKEISRKLGNAYVGTIRGKKHISKWNAPVAYGGRQILQRLIVDPKYQCRGVGQKLLNWGVETADRENLVSWLFCRPPGYKLYLRNGWKVHSTIDFYVPDNDLEVQPVVAMMRLPRVG